MGQETVLITGASSGIGLELARLFARDGSALYLVARDVDKLASVADELRRESRASVRVMAKDLRGPDAQGEIVTEIEREGGQVDVLVNNAGFGALGTVANLDLDLQMEMIAVNVDAPTRLTRLLLPGMLERGRGGILNVASTAAFQAGPNMAVYYATKAYLLHFSEALAEEVRGRGVKVCCLCPGPTATHFAAGAGMEGTRLFRWGASSPQEVAKAGYRAYRQGRVLVVPGVRNQLGVFGVRLLPRSLARKMTGFLQS
jgi:short-subunit dehydrogenase